MSKTEVYVDSKYKPKSDGDDSCIVFVTFEDDGSGGMGLEQAIRENGDPQCSQDPNDWKKTTEWKD
jgi:hypothetical protein